MLAVIYLWKYLDVVGGCLTLTYSVCVQEEEVWRRSGGGQRCDFLERVSAWCTNSVIKILSVCRIEEPTLVFRRLQASIHFPVSPHPDCGRGEGGGTACFKR